MSERLGRRQFIELGFKAPIALSLPSFLTEGEIDEALPLNERVAEIFSLVEPLSFDSKGNLVVERESKEEPDVRVFRRVETIPTQYSMTETRRVNKVELLVVHYDGNDRFWDVSGTKVERHAESTVWLLDRNGFSTHWCVDGFPIEELKEGFVSGYGVLQTQPGSGDSKLPLIGAHVKMGVEDDSKVDTLQLFGKLGIQSRLQSLYERKVGSFNFHTVGFEQVGTDFDLGFPSKNQPDNQQIANALSLSIAVMKQHNLTVWDVVGHHEVQELKSDPGDYYMATLRFRLGVATLKGELPESLVFAGYEEAPDKEAYFRKVYEYLSERKKGWLWHWKDLVGYDEFMKSLSASVLQKEGESKWR